ncbi:phosphatase domain-containing protein [Blastococcus mobilis]|uniref:Phosphatidylserine/phosphatidylglycerophosphate/cardiolipin synthase n=1 Tax=Blastococcus mobilis TaxID=1938746 RepID=A0A238UTL0_9ACTN|nr:phosphatase domain-containing protein [Blastococcus mobilis]SNR25037.1 Phosphatidylserine/phosphatidylglycerophosphate/cardiolipin synthase [Blastococcus mobilis]
MADHHLGAVYDLDGELPFVSLRAVARRLHGLLVHRSWDRRSVLGMSGLLQALRASAPGCPVHYISALPETARRPLATLLRDGAHPPGSLHLTGPGRFPRRLFRGSRAGKLRVLRDLLADDPDRRWVLIGDDGQDDPDLFDELARHHPGRVAAIALRSVAAIDFGGAIDAVPPVPEPGGAPVVRAPNAEELLPPLQNALGLGRPAGRGPEDWLLSGTGRGNDATRLRPFTAGNAVRALVHGRSYFPVLAEQLDATEAGDLVLLLGWRADSDERLTTTGRTVGELLSAAASRGALVRGLLWRSHASELTYSARENRQLAAALRAAGGQILLDMRIRSRGSHHQKLVVVRHRDHPGRDVAFLGGIDLAYSRGDDAAHHGDPQSTSFASVYGPTVPWHDVQLELRGPVVRDAEEVFRERWRDPAALVRLPWHVLPDRLHGLDRTARPLPEPAEDPPAAGTCAVQLLRTYPWRRPAYPFAPRGERSIARAYAKALVRAQRLVYIEDQYLWSVDVARVFAAALRRAPRLHLIAVVPRHPDQDGSSYRTSARHGHAEALAMVHHAGGDRVQVLDVENATGRPIYVHAKICIIDDVWAAVGSDNFNVRSWTHDSELAAAVVDERRDDREPRDPGGLGDGARHFARQLRLQMLREHLATDSDDDLLDPDRAAATVRASAAALDDWHHAPRGPRPPGRLRRHWTPAPAPHLPIWRRWLADPLYRSALDPDGRPLSMRLRRMY